MQSWTIAVLSHVIAKADAMGIVLSVGSHLGELVEMLAPRGSQTWFGCQEDLVLRPSNGVVEASDYLSDRHDWLQLEEECVSPGRRVLYIPAGCTDEVPIRPALAPLIRPEGQCEQLPNVQRVQMSSSPREVELEDQARAAPS